MSLWADLFGTVKDHFRLGLTGVRLKNSSGHLLVRNSGDSADAELTASRVKISGDSFEVNSDAADSGADRKYTLQRPTSGMTAAVTLTLPVDDGTANQVLQTDGSGVLSWAGVRLLNRVTGDGTTATGNGVETSIYSYSVPANTLGTDKRVRLVLPVEILNNSAGARNVIVKLKYGATTLFTFTAPSVPASATAWKGVLHFELWAAGATNAQRGALAGTLNRDALATYEPLANPGHYGTASEDSTAAKTLDILVTLTNNATQSAVAHGAYLEIWP